jgi:hypothetical protein
VILKLHVTFRRPYLSALTEGPGAIITPLSGFIIIELGGVKAFLERGPLGLVRDFVALRTLMDVAVGVIFQPSLWVLKY